MPGDMAMREPDTRVVQQKRDRQVPTGREGRNISTHGILGVEFGVVDVEGPLLGGQDPEVVPVEVEGVVDAGFFQQLIS